MGSAFRIRNHANRSMDTVHPDDVTAHQGPPCPIKTRLIEFTLHRSSANRSCLLLFLEFPFPPPPHAQGSASLFHGKRTTHSRKNNVVGYVGTATDAICEFAPLSPEVPPHQTSVRPIKKVPLVTMPMSEGYLNQ